LKRGFIIKALRAGILVIAGTLAAQSSQAIEPRNIQAGPVYIAPTLGVAARYVDNLLRMDNDKKSTWVTEYTPKVLTWMQDGNNTYSLSYQLEDSHYASSHDDDFTDHQANLDVHHEFNVRNVLNIMGEYYDGHEERGTGLTEGEIAELIDEPVEYESSRLGGDYTYGNRSSRGRLELAARTVSYEYKNFRDFTRFRDRDADTYGATFFWKMGPRTDALLEVRAINNDYDRADPRDFAGSLDSDEMNYLVGMTWDATARTTGSIKVGAYDREYDSSDRSDDDGFQWEVDLTWKPRTYSSVNLNTRRVSQETSGQGDFIDTKEYAVTWDHKWTLRSRTHMSFLFGDDDYSGTERSDDRIELEAGFSHEIQRWLDLGFGYRFEKRDSNARFLGESLDYTQNIFFVEAKLSL
jgi:hypothetical protein